MDRIGSLLDRPKSYYNIDGVGELGIGFMLLCFALLQWLQIGSPVDSRWNRPYMLFIWMGLMCSIIHYGSRAIKQRITYPRTGFVEYRKRDTLWRPLLIGFVFSSLAAIGLVTAIRSHWDLTTPAALGGLILAAAYARGFTGTVRWKWVMVCAMVIGSLVIAMLPADLVAAPANGSWLTATVPARIVGACFYSIVLYGAIFLISGGISFWLYLRHTQAPAQEAQ